MIDGRSQVFGYSILTILFQSKSSFGINAFFGKGVLGLIQAFFFNWCAPVFAEPLNPYATHAYFHG